MTARGLGYLLAFLSAATGALRWNLTVFARERDGVPPVVFLAYALLVGSACSAVHVAKKDGAAGFVPLTGKWKSALLYAVLTGWSTLTHFMALRYLNETVATSFAQLGILVTIAFSVWFLKERFTPREWLATAVVCSGTLFFRPWESGRAGGFVLLFSGLVAGSLAIVGAKRMVEGIPPRVLMAWRNVVATVLIGIYAATLPQPDWSLASVAACAAAGILGPYLHGLFFLQALERIDAAKASLMGRVQPVLVFLVSWLFLARSPGALDLAAAALLVAGAVLLAGARSRK